MIDYSLLSGLPQRPQSNIAGNLTQGYKQGKMTELGNTVRDEFASGKPNMNNMLSGLGDIDPVAAMKMKQNKTSGKGMTAAQAYRYGLKAEEKEASGSLAEEITALENEAMDIISESNTTNVGKNLAPTMKRLYPKRNAYNRLNRKAWISASSDQIDKIYQETKEGRAIDKEADADRDYVMTAYTKLGLGDIDRIFGAATRLNGMYADAVAGTSQPAQQQFLTNMIKMSDASQVLLSEADANKSQSLVSKAEGFLQKIFSGTVIPAVDIKNIYRVGKQLYTAANDRLEDKLTGIADEVTKRGQPMSSDDVRNMVGLKEVIMDKVEGASEMGSFGEVGAPDKAPVKNKYVGKVPKTKAKAKIRIFGAK